MAVKTVVFVQGSKTNEAKFPWMFFHLDPDKDPPDEPIKLAFFDYPAGKLKVWDNHLLKRGDRPPTQKPDFETDLTPKVKIRLEDGSLDTGPDRPSILALYDWVKSQPRDSIRSLQIFSHGFEGGPIIWDSWEYDPHGNEMDKDDGQDRDPNDTDPRVRDFVGKNPLAGAEGRKFAAAFTSDAFIKLWGCVATNAARAPLRAFLAAPRGKRGEAARKAHLQDYLAYVRTTFPMEMARHLNLSVWASPMGYGSQPWDRVPTSRGPISVTYRKNFPPDFAKKDRWWRVSWYFRNYDKGARFYADILKARIDKVDFVEHTEGWFRDAERAAALMGVPSAVATPVDLMSRVKDHLEDRLEELIPF